MISQNICSFHARTGRIFCTLTPHKPALHLCPPSHCSAGASADGLVTLDHVSLLESNFSVWKDPRSQRRLSNNLHIKSAAIHLRIHSPMKSRRLPKTLEEKKYQLNILFKLLQRSGHSVSESKNRLKFHNGEAESSGPQSGWQFLWVGLVKPLGVPSPSPQRWCQQLMLRIVHKVGHGICLELQYRCFLKHINGIELSGSQLNRGFLPFS